MICKNCGIENVDGSTFCKSCGNRIDGKKVCPTCNFLNEETDTFCSKCGTRIDGKKFCLNCGTEVEGAFCTKCGLKYGENIKAQKTTTNLGTKFGFISNILKLVGNGIAMLGALLGLILIFLIGHETATDKQSIFYYFGEAYDDLKMLFSGTGYYSASLETAGYLSTVLTTIVSILCIVCCSVFFILATVRYIKQLCFGGEKSPDLFAVLTIIFYLVCAFSFKSIFYCTFDKDVSSLVSGVDISLNDITKIGSVIAIVLLALYCGVALFNKAITMPKGQIVSFILSTSIFAVLVVLVILLSNAFINCDIHIDGKKFGITTSFTSAPIILSAISWEKEMVGGVVFSGLTQAFLIASITMSLISVAKLISDDKNNTSCFIWIVVLTLFAMILNFVSIGAYSDYLIELLGSGELNLKEYVTMNCPLIIVSFVLSIIPLTLSIVNNILKSK